MATEFKFIEGCLIGGAVGDSIGLPYEGLSNRRARKLFPPPLRQRLVLGRGMLSDDTEHAILTAESILNSHGDPEKFSAALAGKLSRWFLCLPAGIGMATLKACLRLSIGFPPDRSGIYSAGNGPAMRSPIIGVLHGGQPTLMKELVQRSTIITHTHPLAYAGAELIALAAYVGSITRNSADIYRGILEHLMLRDQNSKLVFAGQELMQVVSRHRKMGVAEFCSKIASTSGVGGYMGHTVPVCLHIWLQRPADFSWCVTKAVECGGDTDTMAAIIGSLVGSHTGRCGIPQAWQKGIFDWPYSLRYVTNLARELNNCQGTQRCRVDNIRNALARIPRNLMFLLIILFHGFRRLLPPY